MMKSLKLRLLLAMTAIALVGVLTFTACSDDDETKGRETEQRDPEDNLPEAAKDFIGYWYNNVSNNSSYPDFCFFPDGSCYSYYYNNGYEFRKGSWTYDTITKLLATTIGGWQFRVTLSNSEEWAGISVNSEKAMSFRKGNNIIPDRYFNVWHKGKYWEGQKEGGDDSVIARLDWHYCKQTNYKDWQLYFRSDTTSNHYSCMPIYFSHTDSCTFNKTTLEAVFKYGGNYHITGKIIIHNYNTDQPSITFITDYDKPYYKATYNLELVK